MTLQFFRYGKAIVIDDSYNANPTGFKSALDVLNSFSSEFKRVVVTRGMLELGEKSDELHEQIGGEIAFCADELILITKDFEIPLRKGVGDKYRTDIVVKDNPDDLLKYLETFKNRVTAILLENRLPQSVYEQLIAGEEIKQPFVKA
jgi:UDP-N-acetylmuramoyl-tripeptide--D-alanyl-D-alanine ligase